MEGGLGGLGGGGEGGAAYHCTNGIALLICLLPVPPSPTCTPSPDAYIIPIPTLPA